MSDQFVSIQAENGQVVTVSATWAKATRAKVLKDEPAVDRFGAPLGPRKGTAQPAKKTTAKRTAKKATTRKRASKRTSKKSTASSTSMTSQSSGGAGAASTPEEASK